MGGSLLEMLAPFGFSFGFLAVLQQVIPGEYTDYFRRTFRYYLQRLTPYVYCEVHEYDNATANKLYQDVEMYLSSLTLESAQRVNVCRAKASKAATFTLANDQGIEDVFDKAKVQWVHSIFDRSRPMYGMYFDSRSDEKRKFTLQVKRKDKERMFEAYMTHIESKAKELKREARDLLLYTNSKGQDYGWRRKQWESVPFLHPANFETLALDGDLKTKIISDLEHFAANEQYYRRVGKAWKRGYLLFGPPGTGKSSMIAAIANKMRYDVYDLELTEVASNADLRKLLLQTANKSVIVIEDIDCSLDLSGQRKKKKKKKKEEETSPTAPPGRPTEPEQSKVTLSGLLNFVDGLWSCSGSERIFIFTTNYVKKLDPALLRAGRMDMHIHLGYCTFSAFGVLAKNYLQVTEHELFEEVERAFEGTYMTPAEVTEVLIQNQDEDPSIALESLIVSLGEHLEDPSIKALAAEAEEEEEDSDEATAKEDGDKKASEKEDQSKSKEEGQLTSKESTQPSKISGEKIVPIDEPEIKPEPNSSKEESTKDLDLSDEVGIKPEPNSTKEESVKEMDSIAPCKEESQTATAAAFDPKKT